jgi:hypothetical protein
VSPDPPGTKVESATQGDVRMTTKLSPAAGWLRLNASVGGIPAGENCRLVVVSSDGKREIAGSWIVSPQGEVGGTNLNGSAAIPLDKAVAVEVQNTAGKTFIRVDL